MSGDIGSAVHLLERNIRRWLEGHTGAALKCGTKRLRVLAPRDSYVAVVWPRIGRLFGVGVLPAIRSPSRAGMKPFVFDDALLRKVRSALEERVMQGVTATHRGGQRVDVEWHPDVLSAGALLEADDGAHHVSLVIVRRADQAQSSGRSLQA